MIDRYLGDGGEHLSPPPTAGSRAGGTLDGVRASIESGELDELGITAVWLSPVYLNPTEPREGPWDGRMYEGYHGYWPQESRGVDPRVGGEEAMRALVSAAHARGLRVLLDIVPNHVYETNPIYLDHQGDGWFHDGADKCICGNPPCPWSTHIATCWFTAYLPDYRWKTLEVMQHGAAESRWWTETFDLDGVRVDAVPMMPRAATRRIALEIRDSVSPRSEQFLLGEIFTGPGQDGIDRIRYHLGPDGLDSAPFDGEGTPCRRTPLIEGGVLQGFLYDSYTARKAGRASTGNGLRGSYSSLPGVHPTNLVVEGQATHLDDMLAGIAKGVLVTNAVGVHSGANPITGQFSVGISGILIEGGRLTTPVREVTLAGDVLGMLSGIRALGDDARWVPSGSILTRFMSICWASAWCGWMIC